MLNKLTIPTIVVRLIFIIGIGAYFAYLTQQQIVLTDRGTINSHILFAERIMNGIPVQDIENGIESMPHVGYFYTLIILHKMGLSFNMAAVIVLTLAHLASFLVTYFFYYSFLKDYLPDFFILLGATLSLLLIAIYLPFFNPNVVLGQGSPNIYHNSTAILLKPFATLAFFMIIREFERDKHRLAYILFLGFVLLLSVLAKPTFAIVFLPALGMWLLFRPNLLKNIFYAGLVVLPSLVMMVFQYFWHFASESQGRGITFVLFDVWLSQTHNIPLSLLQALAFPIAVTVLCWSQLKHRNFMLIAWLMVFFGILQFAFIGETNSDGLLFTGNWSGGYLIGLSLIFTVTILEFLHFSSSFFSFNTYERWVFFLLISLLVAHLISSYPYVSALLTRGVLPRTLFR